MAQLSDILETLAQQGNEKAIEALKKLGKTVFPKTSEIADTTDNIPNKLQGTLQDVFTLPGRTISGVGETIVNPGSNILDNIAYQGSSNPVSKFLKNPAVGAAILTHSLGPEMGSPRYSENPMDGVKHLFNNPASLATTAASTVADVNNEKLNNPSMSTADMISRGAKDIALQYPLQGLSSLGTRAVDMTAEDLAHKIALQKASQYAEPSFSKPLPISSEPLLRSLSTLADATSSNYNKKKK